MTIESYLDSLCQSLSVDPLRRDEIRLEVHTHLRQRSDDLRKKGLPGDTAEQWAVEEFGTPEEVALKINWVESPRAATPFGDSRARKTGWLFLLTGAAYAVFFLIMGNQILHALQENALHSKLLIESIFLLTVLHLGVGHGLIKGYFRGKPASAGLGCADFFVLFWFLIQVGIDPGPGTTSDWVALGLLIAQAGAGLHSLWSFWMFPALSARVQAASR